jgi:hypothetical protein
VIGTGLVDHESRPLRVTDEAEGVARDTETALYLGADGDILDVLPQGVYEEPVHGVPAVPADIVAQQSAADSETDLFHVCHASTLRLEGKRNHGPKTASPRIVLLASKGGRVLEMEPNETMTGHGGITWR